MHTQKIKMTDLEVVQRVLDFWDPLGASLYSGGSVGQIDEYDRYAVKVREFLENNSTEIAIREYLDHVRFERIGLKRDERSNAENRFYAWSLKQVWETQKQPDSNYRLADSTPREVTSDGKRQVSSLRLIQMYLEDWDPRKTSEDWLRGANSINAYDEAAVEILKLLELQSSEKILAEAFGWIAVSEGESIGFFINHRNLPSSEVRNLFVKKMKMDSERYRNVVVNLTISYPHFKKLGKCLKRLF